jgi:AraC-like DNA-binding protein
MAYRELPQRDALFACLWTRDDHDEPGTHRILPDACVDIVSVNGRLIVAGPATQAHLATTTGPTFGVRFRVGAAGAALGMPAAELLDVSVPLEDVWGAAEARRIAEQATDVHELAAAIAPRGDHGDPLVRAAATGTPRAALGIGDRQLRRRFLDAVGYGPKTLERILRFQRFLALAATGDADLARLALEAGYADQAHLTRECTRLAGLPPAALLAEGAGPAGERSVSFNTDARVPATMAA